jgi:hypothetical protein
MFFAKEQPEGKVKYGGLEKSFVENLGVFARSLRRKGL